jgi:hypothetical protein
VDGPVFALLGLPESVRAAMFARYSRYPGTLRRLILDEFAGSLPAGAAVGADHPAVAAAMKHVGHSTEPRLERILAELRGETRRAQLTA